MMTHMEAQKMIMPFINGQLNDDELEKFLNHIRTCSECMEELEVYYTLITSMKQLDQDQELSDDYHQDLIDVLNKTDERIKNNKRRLLAKRVFLTLIIGIIGITSTYRIGGIVVEEVIYRGTVSDFIPEEVVLVDPYKRPKEIEDQLLDIYVYLRQTDQEAADAMADYYGEEVWDNMIIQKEFGEATYIPEWTVLYY